MAIKCLDSYAIIELTKGNRKFKDLERSQVVIPDPILAEVYGVLLRTYNEITADYWLKKLKVYAKSVNIKTLVSAIKFKHENRKQKISFFDSVGYVYARDNKIKFVTGDKAFKDKPNVDFRKK